MIPLSAAHLRSILREWVTHYNGGRPHSALGPGVFGPPAGSARAPRPEFRRPWTPGALVLAKAVLGACTDTPSRRRRRSRMEYGPLNRMPENAEVLKSGG